MESREKLYERIGKTAAAEAWALGIEMSLRPKGDQCSLCPCEFDCDQDWACEEQIADALWTRAEEKA